MIRELLSLINRGKSKQVAGLYAGTVLQLLLGVVTSVIIARTLKPEQYGHYSYIFNLANLMLLLVSTGHFVSTSMILAKSQSESEKRSLLGTSLLISLVVSGIFGALIFFFSFIQDTLFNDKIGASLRLLSLPLILFPMQTYLESVLMGLNHIKELSILRIAPKALYIAALFIYMKLGQLNYISTFVLMLLTSYLVYVLHIIKLKPSFNNLAGNLHFIETENKRYGFHVYVGSIASVAITYLSTLSISYFTNNTKLGFFNLALTLTSPLLLVPNVIATTFFKKFASMTRIPSDLVKYTLALSLASYVIFALIVNKLILTLYSAEYSESATLSYILGIAMVIHGLGDVYNRFLCAKARGKEVRNGAFVAGAVNIVSILILVPIYSGIGAALSRLFVGITYLLCMYLYYRNLESTWGETAHICQRGG